MDKLLNEFTVIRPIEETWKVLTDIERIAPCMPGATLEEVEGDVFRGIVKVKLGAISTAFKGQANFIERDDTNHRAVLKAEGRDTTGKGNAAAEILAHLEEVDPDDHQSCRRDRPAHHGQGRPVRPRHHGRCQQEAHEPVRRPTSTPCSTSNPSRPPHGAAENQPAPRTGRRGEGSSRHGDGRRPIAPPTRLGHRRTHARQRVRKINGPAAAPIELSDVAGSAILKRAACRWSAASCCCGSSSRRLAP